MNNTTRTIAGPGCFLLLFTLIGGPALVADSTPTMSQSEAKELIAKASTPEDHHRLAAYFTQKADNMEAEAVEHDELAKEYASHPNGMLEMKHPGSGGTASHCKYFSQAARKAEAEDRALAAAHESMAKTSQK